MYIFNKKRLLRFHTSEMKDESGSLLQGISESEDDET